MTPEIIKTISKLRSDFYTAFAAAMDEPVRISGNSYNSLACIASWVDRNHRLNYLTIYAFSSPDQLATHRPFILRLSINKGAGTVALPRQGQMCQGSNQQWRFEMTLLPEELLHFLPWIVDLVQAQGHHSFAECPPYPTDPDCSGGVTSTNVWTLAAKQAMEAQKLVELSSTAPAQPEVTAETPSGTYGVKQVELSSPRLWN